MMKRISVIITVAALLAASCCQTAFAQSNTSQKVSFKLGQWTEIQNNINSYLARFYVDSLPADRMFRAGIDAMLEALDPYTVYVPEEEQESFEMMITNSYGGIGAIIYKPEKDGYVFINEPYENSPAALAGLQCGDRIIAINGESTIGLDASQASSKMKGKAETDVHFRVLKVHSADTVDYTITRKKIHLPSVEYYGMLDSRTGYIYQSRFTENVSEEVREAFLNLKKQGMERLILDLRGNGGGLMDEAIKILSFFLPENTLVVTSKGSDGEREYRTGGKPLDTEIPLMLMVDSGSASSSEIVSGAIQDLDRGTIAGKRTFGKGLVQRILPIAYNGQLKLTISKYYTPSGRCVQAKDYSNRAEDGSVGNIPDSLIHEFKTLKGRIVKDGGGITPDLVIESKPYNRITVAAVAGGLTSNWPLEYVKKHKTIAPVDEFKLSDAEYEEFAEWGAKEAFDIRSESETCYDILVKQMKKDGIYEDAKEALDQIEKIVRMEKKEALMRNKEHIRPLLEEEIVTRYYYQKAGIKIRLRDDSQLWEALKQWK